MQSVSHPEVSKLPAVPLGHIFAYLDFKSLNSARLICRHWNDVVLEQFPSRVAARPTTLPRLSGSPDVDFFKKCNARVFRVIREQKSSNEKDFRLTSFLSYLKAVNYNQMIVEMEINICEALDGLALIVNFQELPNLRKLTAQQLPENEEKCYVFQNFFLPNSLPGLEILRQYSAPHDSKAERSRRFFQSLFDAAVNLVEIQLDKYFKLDNHRQLRRLHACDIHQFPEDLLSVLDAVKGKISFLAMSQFLSAFSLPLMLNLKNLEIRNTIPNAPFFNIADAAPNLKTLRMGGFSVGYQPYCSRFVASWPQNLKYLNVECCRSKYSRENHHLLLEKLSQDLPTQFSNLEVLKVRGSCSLDEVETLQSILNIDFPNHFILLHRNDSWRGEWLNRILVSLERVEVRERKDKGSCLELRSGRQTNVEEIRQDLMVEFPKTMSLLLKRWERIVIKNMNIKPHQFESLMEGVGREKLPVGLHFSFGRDM